MSNPEMQARFLAEHRCTCPGAGYPPDPLCAHHGSGAEKFREKRRRQSLKRQSEKQKVREGFLSGVKAERLRHVRHCEKCGVAPDDVWESLQLHHTEKRSQGTGYRGGLDFGVDAPGLLILECPKCHQSEHGEPRFGED